MSLLTRILGGPDRTRLQPLYSALVAIGRDPAWYRDGGVPDTLNGRFDMIAAVLALALLRLERDDRHEARLATTLLTELFVDDMDGSLRQVGIGDLVVGKHMGRVMSAFGGRLAAFRPALADPAGMTAAVDRNIFHEAAPSRDALDYVTERLLRFSAALEATTIDRLLAGEVERP